MAKLLGLSIVIVLFVPSLVTAADTADYSVVMAKKNIGHLTVDTKGDLTTVDFDVKNNGRGPTISETIRTGPEGVPVEWSVKGRTTFGSKVEEHFNQTGSQAQWTDSTGPGTAKTSHLMPYVTQNGSPWSEQILARLLLKAPGMSMAVLPSGRLHLEKGETLTVQGPEGPLEVTRYDLAGIDLSPSIVLLDAKDQLFAAAGSVQVLIRKGYEAEASRLATLAGEWAAQRLTKMEKEVAHRYKGPVRIRNVRIFDPKTSMLTEPVSVLVQGKKIAAVAPLASAPTPGEVTVDGAGGTLIAGMYEMHAHLQQDGALLNLMAGITSVRDMGNDNAVLDKLIQRIDDGEVGGPHVIRSGFIEGQSPFSAGGGILVDSQEKAVDAVRWYGARGYWQIKIYNSMNPAWVAAMAREAHQLGMRVTGHVPAFSSADQMLDSGYDELTHINQFMLGWVIGADEDTRTLFRLTALKRLPSLDLNSPKVQRTIGMMVDGHKAIDPTLAIHEQLTSNRDGQVPPGAADYLDHMPVGYRRNAMKAMTDTSAPGDDQAYRGAFEKILATVRLLHDRGVFIVFGTDLGGSFAYHRELELYQRVGMTPPEILKRATFDSAKYVSQDQQLGSIEKGKLADFFLVPGDPTKNLKAIKTISMVVKDGTFYFPTEVYPKFGIEPFTGVPTVTQP
ncbi:MAG: amidohydrolase family protein [Bryobacteraceae bacterium]